MMLPLFRKTERIDLEDTNKAVKQLYEHILDFENQVEDMLMKLDNVNLLALDLSDMELYTENGSKITGDTIKMKRIVADELKAGRIVADELDAGRIVADELDAGTIERGGEAL